MNKDYSLDLSFDKLDCDKPSPDSSSSNKEEKVKQWKEKEYT